MIRVFTALLLLTSTFSVDFKLSRCFGEEQRGEGLTDQEANFIKARLLEIQKQSEHPKELALILQETLSSLGGNWATYAVNGNIKTGAVGLELPPPFEQKWLNLRGGFGVHPENIYSIWKERSF